MAVSQTSYGIDAWCHTCYNLEVTLDLGHLASRKSNDTLAAVDFAEKSTYYLLTTRKTGAFIV